VPLVSQFLGQAVGETLVRSVVAQLGERRHRDRRQRRDALHLDPSLPDDLECLQVVRYRGHGLELRFSHDGTVQRRRAQAVSGAWHGTRLAQAHDGIWIGRIASRRLPASPSGPAFVVLAVTVLGLAAAAYALRRRATRRGAPAQRRD
jgi:hypothetical protein